MAPSECLAGPGEHLALHLAEVARCVGVRGIYVARKLAKVFETSPELAMDFMEFAALMHDVGKADAAYEASAEYFPLHEARSTDFAYEVMLKVKEKNASMPLRNSFAEPSIANVALFAIAFHHYSHKTYERTYERYSVGGLTPRCYDYRQAIQAWSPRTELGKALRDVALALPGTTRTGTHGRLLGVIVKRMHPKLLYAASAVLGIINECDVEVAKKNRRLST
jgi:CRISPR-associated endonuclease Cas3-HD